MASTSIPSTEWVDVTVDLKLINICSSISRETSSLFNAAMTIGTLPYWSETQGLTERDSSKRQHSNFSRQPSSLRWRDWCSRWIVFLLRLLLLTSDSLFMKCLSLKEIVDPVDLSSEEKVDCGMWDGNLYPAKGWIDFKRDRPFRWEGCKGFAWEGEASRTLRRLKWFDTPLNQLLISWSYRTCCLYVPLTDRSRSDSAFAVLYALSKFLLEMQILKGG